MTADAIAKIKIKDDGFRPIVGDDISGFNGMTEGVKMMVMVTNLTPRIKKCKKVDCKWTRPVNNKKNILLGDNWSGEGKKILCNLDQPIK